jgi:hypothetical protein
MSSSWRSVARGARSAWLPMLGLLVIAPLSAPGQEAAAPAVPPAEAAGFFVQARVICERDHGRFWGRSLCGPILLVIPETRAVTANQADARGALAATGAVFTGVLPTSVNIANSPTDWSGVHWTQLIWPLIPTDEATRHVMLAHELFHRIQPGLNIPSGDGDNAHLDTLEGRYWLQLEWRALARALQADTAQGRRRAIDDALAFRAERYRLFPAAAENERLLEMAEGVPEYTGVRLGLADPAARTAYAVHDLTLHVEDPTFVRSFAYATGPAYGLLLDQYSPGWRGRLTAGPRLDVLLRAALPAEPGPQPSLADRAAAYGGPALHAAEVERDRKRQAMLAAFRARLVDGPVLHIPMHKTNHEFNPRALQPLGDAGTVYPHIHVSGSFGILEADNGALMSKDGSDLALPAAGADVQALKGDGWSLTLNPGWTIKPGGRPGDLRLIAPARP